MKIAIIGAGSWGTTLANLLAENNPDKEVILWARETEVIDSIENENENELFLPGIKLSENLKSTADLEKAVSDADILVTAIPSQFLREKAKEINKYIKEHQTI